MSIKGRLEHFAEKHGFDPDTVDTTADPIPMENPPIMQGTPDAPANLSTQEAPAKPSTEVSTDDPYQVIHNAHNKVAGLLKDFEAADKELQSLKATLERLVSSKHDILVQLKKHAQEVVVHTEQLL